MGRAAVDPRSPCIIGVGQRTVRPGHGPSPEPLVLWEDFVRAACAEADEWVGRPVALEPAAGGVNLVHAG